MNYVSFPLTVLKFLASRIFRVKFWLIFSKESNYIMNVCILIRSLIEYLYIISI
jgi:hypothetical protein